MKPGYQISTSKQEAKGISAVILNWKRPKNVLTIVRDGWEKCKLINDKIVWNNNPEQPFTYAGAKCINCSQDLGLYTRFIAGQLTKNECILIQDDDLFLPEETIRSLFDHWCDDQDIIHGIFGRAPTSDNRYTYKNTFGEVPIVLTRVFMVHRDYMQKFFSFALNFDDLQKDSQPYGNGEDIIFSYSVVNETGRNNCAYHLPVEELPNSNAINQRYRKLHLSHRNNILKRCLKVLDEKGIL